MAWTSPMPAPAYANWRVDSDEEQEYLGTVAPEEEEEPLFYESESGRVYGGEIDRERERLISHEEPSWEVKAEETLGEFLERIGKDIGWESLSEFSREHLEHEED